MGLNKKAKVLMINALIMTIILIATVILFLIKAGENGLEKGELLIAILVVGLVFVAFGVIIAIRKIRDIKQGKMAQDYKNVLEDIMTIVDTSNMSSMQKRQIREDLLDMFFQASADQRDVMDVIGKDKEQFAADIIEAHGAKNNFWTYELSGVQFFVFYLIFAHLYEYVKTVDKGIGFFAVPVDVSLIFLFGATALVTLPLILLIKTIGLKREKPYMLIIGFVVVTVLTAGMFIGFLEMIQSGLITGRLANYIQNASVIIFNDIWMWITAAVVVALAWWLKRIIRTRKLKLILNH